MPILNYTTKVDPHRSVNEIQKILGGKGCKSISIDYDASGRPQAVCFLLLIGDNEIFFRLPRNAQMGEVFLPYAITNKLGQTMFQRFLESNTKQLAAVNE